MPRKPPKTPPKTQKEKRALATELLLKESALSNRVIARNVGMSHTTVGIVRQELVEAGRIGQTRTATILNVNHPYIKVNPQLLNNLNAKTLRVLHADGVLDMMAAKSLTNPAYAQRLVRKERLAAAEAVYAPLTAADIKLYCVDVYDGLPFIPSESVDSAILDPPYHDVAVHKACATVAARVLRPGGLLVILTGQNILLRSLKLLMRLTALHIIGSARILPCTVAVQLYNTLE